MADVKGKFILMGLECVKQVANFKMKTIIEKLKETSGLTEETIKPEAWYKTEETLCIIVDSCQPKSQTMMGEKIYEVIKASAPEFFEAAKITDPLSSVRGIVAAYDANNKPLGAFKEIESKPGYFKMKDSSAHAADFMKGLHIGALRMYGARDVNVNYTIQSDGSRLFEDIWK